MTDFLTGNLTNHQSKISWKGKYGNQTYHQIRSILFKNNYTNFSMFGSKSENIFVSIHGFCKKFIEFNSADTVTIKTRENMQLLIVDPNKKSKLRIKEMDNPQVYLGLTTGKYFSIAYYENIRRFT